MQIKVNLTIGNGTIEEVLDAGDLDYLDQENKEQVLYDMTEEWANERIEYWYTIIEEDDK